MKPLGMVVAVVGALLALAGLVFILQSLGYVGPEGSFMFENPTWTYAGAGFALVGLAILVVSLRSGMRGGGSASP